MKKDKNVNLSKDNGSMLTQKTNEDFNKKQPLAKDFVVKKGSTDKESYIKSSVSKPKVNKRKNENRETTK